MSSGFTNHFAPVAASYRDYRPHYPDALFAWLAQQCERQQLVWDCGAGSGQASVGLAEYFDKVLATDASAEQLAQAPPHERINYRTANAAASGLANACVDLVTVAQALHWFDLPSFYAEAHRVLHPGGVLAVWSYGNLRSDDTAVAGALHHFHYQVVGPYWPPERQHVETGYRQLPFPYPAELAPAFTLTAHWTLEQLLGYLRSWSATARYQAAEGEDPVERLARQLLPIWEDPWRRLEFRWPLALVVGRKPLPPCD